MSTSSGGAKKTVDEIWRDLNTRQASGPAGSRANLAGINNLPGISTTTRILPKASGPSLSHLPGTLCSSTSSEAAAAAEDVPINRPASRPLPPHYDPAQAGVKAEELQACVSGLQRTINCLSDPDRSTRRQAVQARQGFAWSTCTPQRLAGSAPILHLYYIIYRTDPKYVWSKNIRGSSSLQLNPNYLGWDLHFFIYNLEYNNIYTVIPEI